MKILFIASEFAPGMIPFGVSIINAVTNHSNHEVYAVVVSNGALSYKNKLSKKVQKVEYIEAANSFFGKLLNKFYPVKLINTIDEICKKHKIDIVHLLTGDFTLNQHIKYIQKKHLLLYNVHDYKRHNAPSTKLSLKNMIDSYIYKSSLNIVRKTKNLITSGRQQYEMLKHEFPKKKIFFHRFPSLITEKEKAGNRKMEELKNIKDYILFFGFISEYKGLDLLYNAYINNEKVCTTCPLVIAGKGDWYFERNIQREQNVIRINRHIDDSEIKSLYLNAKCVVYPYRSATQSGVLSLAYYFQTPTLCSDIPFMLDNLIKDQTAFEFKSDDIKSLSAQLEKLTTLSSSQIDEMKQNQAAYYQTHYSPKALAQELSDTYNLLKR